MSSAISSSAWQLYVIVDPAAANGREPAWLADQAIRGGADVVQLRDKSASTQALIETAKHILQVSRAARIPLIINDRVDVVVAAGAEGVHLGQDDLPVSVARRILGPGRLIGKSTHSLQQALEADAEGVDYVAVGPIYPTPTKPDYGSVGLGLIGEVSAKVRRPMVTIGGIDEATLPEVLAAGSRCVAVVRAVCGVEDPAAAARSLKQRVRQFVSTRPSSSL